MGVRILQGDGTGDSHGAVLYCSTTMWAFGPVFESENAAETFVQWLGNDPRIYSESDLNTKYHTWLEEMVAEPTKAKA